MPVESVPVESAPVESAPVESGLAAAVLPPAAGALPVPLHAESSDAPPAAAANRSNVRRAGGRRARW